MILFLSDKYLEQVKSLWKQAFGDSDESVEFYFSHLHKNENMLIDVEGDTVTSMLTMFPVEIMANGKTLNGRYVYAVATDNGFKRLGKSTSLLEYAHKIMRDDNVALSVLVPANDALFDFYEKRGYNPIFSVKDEEFLSKDIKCENFSYTFDICSADEYYDIREKAFSKNSPFVAWDKNTLKSVMDYTRFFGDEFYTVSASGKKAVMHIRVSSDRIFVNELALDGLTKEQVLYVLSDRFGADKHIIRVPSQNGKPFAMAYSPAGETFNYSNAYFNLSMG